MKLYAISDLHLGYQANRQALAALPAYPEDWLIVAGDLGDTIEQHRYAISHLARRFAQLIWVPGNHDLWSLPSVKREENYARGEEKYQQLVAICREYGALTPEDPYITWPGEGVPALLVPMFLLYDYSFRPENIPLEDALAWAEETDVLCTDEVLLHSDPYASRADWCRARCALTEQRLAREVKDRQVIFINHFPLLQTLVRLKYIPRFSLWCGTRLTEDWHLRYSTLAVVYGHLHMRSTEYQCGVRFEEVSLGYPQQWQSERGLQSYLREILPGPPLPEDTTPITSGPFWHK